MTSRARRRLAWLAALAALAACTSDRRDVYAIANTRQCPMQVVEGVDVYSGDGTIDWTKLKASGRAFAFIKATQGNYNKQSTFATAWSAARAAGVIRSPYHFFDPTVDGAAQATYFLDEVAAAGGLVAGDLAPMLDIECPTSSVQASAQPDCEHAGDSGWAPPATLAARVFDWLAAVERATGRKPILYSYPAWFGDAGFTDPRLADYPLFIATYASCASVPAPWTSAVFWQYSATASVPGIATPADVDRFFGTPDQLTQYTGVTRDAGVTGDAAIAPTTAAGCGCRSDGRGAGGALVIAIALAVARVRPRSRTRRCR